MFGADICAAMCKVHFIPTRNSPNTEEYTEYHLRLPSSVQSDERTRVFTAISKFQILVDRKEKTLPYQAPDLHDDEKGGEFNSEVSYWATTPFKVKAEIERQKKTVFDFLHKITHVPSLSRYKHQILDHIQKAKNRPELRTGDYNLALIFIPTGDYNVALIFIALIITILFAWKKIASFRSTSVPLVQTELEVFDNLHYVRCSRDVIETVVTKRAKEVDAWIGRIRSTYKGKPTVVGLDCEWKPNTARLSIPNKAATLQLCVDTKCLIIQLFYMDVPQSVHSFLSDPNFIYVGVEVKGDLQKLRNEYGISCIRFDDLRDLALRSEAYEHCYRYGLRNLASHVAGLEISKSARTCRSNWEARDLSKRQIQYASIDAYASYRIGHKLIHEMQD